MQGHTVEFNPYGFGVNAYGQPLTMLYEDSNDLGFITFHGRMWAHIFATACEIGDYDAASETFRAHGRLYGKAAS